MKNTQRKNNLQVVESRQGVEYIRSKLRMYMIKYNGDYRGKYRFLSFIYINNSLTNKSNKFTIVYGIFKNTKQVTVPANSNLFVSLEFADGERCDTVLGLTTVNTGHSVLSTQYVDANGGITVVNSFNSPITIPIQSMYIKVSYIKWV